MTAANRHGLVEAGLLGTECPRHIFSPKKQGIYIYIYIYYISGYMGRSFPLSISSLFVQNTGSGKIENRDSCMWCALRNHATLVSGVVRPCSPDAAWGQLSIPLKVHRWRPLQPNMCGQLERIRTWQLTPVPDFVAQKKCIYPGESCQQVAEEAKARKTVPNLALWKVHDHVIGIPKNVVTSQNWGYCSIRLGSQSGRSGSAKRSESKARARWCQPMTIS